MKLKQYNGAGIALFRKKGNSYEILLGKRSVKRDFGKWSIPGGKKEAEDKDFETAAFREFKEETGLSFFSVSHFFWGQKHISLPFFNWKTFIYLTDDNDYKFVPCEFSELRWIPLSELGKYELCFGVKSEVRRFLWLIKIHPYDFKETQTPTNEQILIEAQKMYEQNGILSSSQLQRKFHIGYNKAAELKEMIEQANVKIE